MSPTKPDLCTKGLDKTDGKKKAPDDLYSPLNKIDRLTEVGSTKVNTFS
jgi:hypothetical protein